MNKISTILTNPVKKSEANITEQQGVLEQIINESKEKHIIDKLLDKAVFVPSNNLIEQIFTKCDFKVSH